MVHSLLASAHAGIAATIPSSAERVTALGVAASPRTRDPPLPNCDCQPSPSFAVKETIRKYLETAGYLVDDQGTASLVSVDYPDYGKAVGERVAAKQADLGIVVCGTGMGISIAANKVLGIRAALAHNVMTAQLAREHNDANILARRPRGHARRSARNGSNLPGHQLRRRPPSAPPG